MRIRQPLKIGQYVRWPFFEPQYGKCLFQVTEVDDTILKGITLRCVSGSREGESFEVAPHWIVDSEQRQQKVIGLRKLEGN